MGVGMGLKSDQGRWHLSLEVSHADSEERSFLVE